MITFLMQLKKRVDRSISTLQHASTTIRLTAVVNIIGKSGFANIVHDTFFSQAPEQRHCNHQGDKAYDSQYPSTSHEVTEFVICWCDHQNVDRV
jgi:hypothetical protein